MRSSRAASVPPPLPAAVGALARVQGWRKAQGMQVFLSRVTRSCPLLLDLRWIQAIGGAWSCLAKTVKANSSWLSERVFAGPASLMPYSVY